MRYAILILCLATPAATAQSIAQASIPAKAVTKTTPKKTKHPGVWNQWRGATRNGHVSGPAWPKRLTEDNFTKVWTHEAGPSYSGPIVSSSVVFTTATEDREAEVVTALDRDSGKVLWKTDWDGAMTVPFFAKRNGSWIRSTPAFDGESLYVAGMRDVLVCLNAKDGKERWRVNFVERFRSNLEAFGFVCSPLIQGDSVIVQTGAGVVRLDKRTGKTTWLSMKDKGGMFGGAFSSPIVAKLKDKEQLLIQSRTALNGLDLESGNVLWSVPVKTFRGMNILTPLPYKDTVFTSAYGGRGHLFQVGGATDEGDIAVEEAWNNRVQAYMTSPVQIGKYAYVLLRSKRFCCFDMETGKVQWTSKNTGNTYWSLVANGDRMLALTDDGNLMLIAANPKEFEVIDEIHVSDDETWAHLAVDGDQVMIRSLRGLTTYNWK